MKIIYAIGTVVICLLGCKALQTGAAVAWWVY